MHRNPKRMRDATEAEENKRQRRQAFEDRDFFEQEAVTRLDNRDRMRSFSYSRVPTGYVARLDAMRTSGNQAAARAFRSERQPLFSNLYWTDTYQADRNRPHFDTYFCLNCGKRATPTQLARWYNPGVHPLELSVTMPLMDAATSSTGESRALAPLLPGVTEMPYPTTKITMFPARGTRPAHLTAVPGLFGGVTPQDVPPTAFVCSKECYDEQMQHNHIRARRFRELKNARDQLLLEHPDTRSRAFHSAIGRKAGFAELPSMIYDDIQSRTEFANYDWFTGSV